MKAAMAFLWKNRTRTLGFVEGIVGILAVATDIFPSEALKWLLLSKALMTYSLGQFNSWQAKRDA